MLTVIPEEFAAVRNALGTHQNISGTPYYVQDAKKRRVWDVVTSRFSARSNVPAAGEVAEVIEDLRPQILILVGIAGGMCDNGQPRDGVALGDVVIAEYVSYVEFVKVTNAGPLVRNYALDHPSIALIRRVAIPIQVSSPRTAPINKPDGSNIFRVHLGELVSGEKIMGSRDDPVQIELLKPFDKAIAVDMESVGMARMVCERRSSFWYHPRYAVIRGISDFSGQENNNAVREQWKAFAAASAATVAREFIAAIPIDLPG